RRVLFRARSDMGHTARSPATFISSAPRAATWQRSTSIRRNRSVGGPSTTPSFRPSWSSHAVKCLHAQSAGEVRGGGGPPLRGSHENHTKRGGGGVLVALWRRAPGAAEPQDRHAGRAPAVPPRRAA